MNYSGSKNRLFTRQFWKTVETKHYLLFLFAVFFTFSSMGLVGDLLGNLRYSYSTLITAVIFSGLISVGYAYASTKHWWVFPIIIVIQIGYLFFIRQNESIELTTEFIYQKSRFVGFGLLILVILGYAFFIIFITKVGINHFLLKAEMDLAKGIHDVLVPEIKYKTDKIDIYGKSIPTSEVGGDLVDVYRTKDGLYCTIADVSGHGVSSGVYTGMFKSSLRTILFNRNNLDEILTQINDSLVPLTKKNMFITSSIIKFANDYETEYTLAGHLPILHFVRSENVVKEHLIKQIPIGVKAAFQFKSGKFRYAKGDIVALITDGITETLDKRQKEFGIDRVKEIIKINCEKSAEELANLIVSEVEKFGNQKDDNTLLLIKRLS